MKALKLKPTIKLDNKCIDEHFTKEIPCEVKELMLKLSNETLKDTKERHFVLYNNNEMSKIHVGDKHGVYSDFDKSEDYKYLDISKIRNAKVFFHTHPGKKANRKDLSIGDMLGYQDTRKQRLVSSNNIPIIQCLGFSSDVFNTVKCYKEHNIKENEELFTFKKGKKSISYYPLEKYFDTVIFKEKKNK